MERMEVVERKVLLSGITSIMFSRYPGDNETELLPEKKFYFADDGETLILPSLNILSFLCAQNTESAAKRFLKPKVYKKVAGAILSYVSIQPDEIPFTMSKKPIKFTGFNKDGKFYVRHDVARLPKGIPNPQARPVMKPPWELGFSLSLFLTKELDEEMLVGLFERGGIAIGLGTFRGVFGKFKVEKWE